MLLVQPAVAGTLESCDIQITLRPNPHSGVEITLESDVKALFGEAIRQTISNTLSEYGVDDALVQAVDHGAIDCVIRARMQCAIFRAARAQYDWSKED